MLPISAPAQAVQISPEALEVANSYLQLQNMEAVSLELNLPVEIVSSFLERREVRAYIDQVFFDVGFNNKHHINWVKKLSHVWYIHISENILFDSTVQYFFYRVMDELSSH